MPAVIRDKEDSSESSQEDEQEDHPCIAWSGLSRKIPVLVFCPEAIVSRDLNICSIGERYNMAFKIVRTESRLVRGILSNHGFHEVHPNSNDFNLMWTGSHLKPYLLRSLQDFQKVNHFPRSYELTRKDRLYKNIQRMQQAHGFKNFHIVPQTFVLPSEYQDFCSCFVKDKGPWIIKPVASSRGRGIYLVSNPNQISMDENILVSRYISNPLLIDDFKFDVRLYVLVTSYDPLLVYVYEEGLARFATVKYDRASKNIRNQFMHLTNYSVNKKSSDYVSCDDPEVEDYGNKWSMSAMLRYLKQEGRDTTLLMSQVEDLIVKAVLSAELHIATACKMFVPHRTNCFELYGFDVLIDSNLKPWLLEVNLSPSLACDAPLDLKIKSSMLSDMFSLVGFVCQDPLLRQPHSDRGPLDSRRSQRQRTVSANNPEEDGSKVKLGGKQGLGDSTLGLSTEEIKVLRKIKEEHERRGGFIRIFPTADTWELYSGYLECKTSMNSMLANRLFHERKLRDDTVQLQVALFHAGHVFQYERKLPTLEARRRRQRLARSARSAPGNKTSGRGRDDDDAFPAESGAADEAAEEPGEGDGRLRKRTPQQREARDVVERRAPEPVSHRPPPPPVALQTEPVAAPRELVRDRAAAATSSSISSSSSSASLAARRRAEPKVDLLHILQQGWELSKVQARVAFSSYLQRVQLRLLAESKTNATPAWPDRDNEQMELMIRFLKRASSNLQQDVRMVLPSRQLPLRDRRRILSHQLGEFLQRYDAETQHMLKRQEKGSEEEQCINPGVFQEYIAEASENDLEEVLTFYTHRNKSASVFLGTKVRNVKKECCEKSASGDTAKCEHPKSLQPVTTETSSSGTSESSLRVASDPGSKANGGGGGGGGARPSVRTSAEPQRSEVKASPAALDSAHIQLHHHQRHQRRRSSDSDSDSLPLHCPPPASQPPPAYTASMAKSRAASRCSVQRPAVAVAAAAPQPPRVIWAASSLLPPPSGVPAAAVASVPRPSPPLRRIRSFTSSSSSPPSAGTSSSSSSVPSAVHIYSQKLSRPTSAGQAMKRGGSAKPKPDSAAGAAVVSKELNSLSAQAQSNQRAIISALQRLADKQAARHYTSSSHIGLLTQHLTNLNLANGVLSRGAITFTPPVRHTTVTQGPLKAVHSDPGLASSTGHRQLMEDEGVWDAETQSAYSLATGVSPHSSLATGVLGPQQQQQQQPYRPTQGSYQLQFAIQQLQQQRLLSRQLLDHSRSRHQALLPDPRAATGSSTMPSARHNPGPSQARPVGPVLTPKPPSGGREGPVRKTATQRLSSKQTSSEGPTNGTTSSGQHGVYEAVCGKTGLSAYGKLLHGQGPKHR